MKEAESSESTETHFSNTFPFTFMRLIGEGGRCPYPC